MILFVIICSILLGLAGAASGQKPTNSIKRGLTVIFFALGVLCLIVVISIELQRYHIL